MQFLPILFAVGGATAAALNYDNIEIDPSVANVTDGALRQLAARADQCHDATGQTSQWANAGNDGNGRYVGSCGDSGHGKNKCWTDVYLTQAQVQWHPWMKASDNLQCQKGKKDMCHINHLDQLQSCKSESDSVSISAGLTDGIANIGASYTHETTTQQCLTSANSYTCDWDNGACHRIVASYKYVRYWGYVRRSCNTSRGNNGSPHPRPGDGKYTVGWADWQMDLPTSDNTWEYSCKYHCETDLASKSKDLPEAGPVVKI